jgi:outer membrane protein OmpA-like peptidoglycan-associated protein
MAQNLVKNPSFEDFVQCPQEFGTFQDDVLFWTIPTISSTDYFNSCSAKMTVDRNFTGKQETFHGNAYVGLYAYGPKNYREYIQGELKTKLQKGNNYEVSVMISLSEKSDYAIDEFGFMFSSKEVHLEIINNIPHSLLERKEESRYTPVKERNFFIDKENWMEVKAEYTADGTERFVTFGNFKENKKTRKSSTGSHLKKAGYYYVDMVSLVETSKPYNLDEIYVFEGLNFDVNGFEIGKEVTQNLQPLIEYLMNNPSVNIAIYGHTDNVGNQKYNKDLSEKRAKTLGLFLVDNGLSPSRIAWQGFGDIKPVFTNETKEGREENRRVEFVISKKKREFYASGLFEDNE